MFLTVSGKSDKLPECSKLIPSEHLYHPHCGPFTVTPPALSPYITITTNTVFIYYHTEHGYFIRQKAYIHGANHDRCTVKGSNKREARYYVTTVNLPSLTSAVVKFQPLMQWHARTHSLTHTHTHTAFESLKLPLTSCVKVLETVLVSK